MKRKGWHRKKRRLHHARWLQVVNTIRNLLVRDYERKRRFNVLLAKTMAEHPEMGPFRASLEISREEIDKP